jgi:hypothetical protein
MHLETWLLTEVLFKLFMFEIVMQPKSFIFEESNSYNPESFYIASTFTMHSK